MINIFIISYILIKNLHFLRKKLNIFFGHYNLFVMDKNYPYELSIFKIDFFFWFILTSNLK
nr:MAG TPA: hypothetical protein [Caudoviricetes sp.]